MFIGKFTHYIYLLIEDSSSELEVQVWKVPKYVTIHWLACLSAGQSNYKNNVIGFIKK